MVFYLNTFEDDSATFELEPQGPAVVPITVENERAARCLACLCMLESFEVSMAIAELLKAVGVNSSPAIPPGTPPSPGRRPV